jgi:hypothetical protein
VNPTNTDPRPIWICERMTGDEIKSPSVPRALQHQIINPYLRLSTNRIRHDPPFTLTIGQARTLMRTNIPHGIKGQAGIYDDDTTIVDFDPCWSTNLEVVCSAYVMHAQSHKTLLDPARRQIRNQIIDRIYIGMNIRVDSSRSDRYLGHVDIRQNTRNHLSHENASFRCDGGEQWTKRQDP